MGPKDSRKDKRKLTRFEMEIMGALWETGQASVREIQERLPKRDRPAYTTVQTIVRRLQEKEAVPADKDNRQRIHIRSCDHSQGGSSPLDR